MKQTSKSGHIKILTANDLRSGGVVFASDDNSWSPYISQAQLASDSTMMEALTIRGEQAVNSQLVVEPAFIEVVVENGLPRPLRFREQLRVNGPSVQTTFLKPAYDEVA